MGGFDGSLPSVAVLVVYSPVGREDERAGNVLLLFFPPFNSHKTG